MVDAISSFMLNVAGPKVRNIITKRFRRSGAFGEKLSYIIESDLCKMQRRLKGLTKKDLVESIDLFLEGFALGCLQADDNEVDAGPSSPKRARMDLKNPPDQIDACDILDARKSLSDEAKKRFKDARKKAGSAIANNEMKTEEVILATWLKVSSQILETDDLATAFNFCLHYLQRLHSHEDVIKNFDDEFTEDGRNLRLPPARAAARKIICCVCRLNRFVFDIVNETGDAERSAKLFKAWPPVQVGKERKIDPLRDPELEAIFKLENQSFPIAPPLRPVRAVKQSTDVGRAHYENATPQNSAKVGSGTGTKRKLTYV